MRAFAIPITVALLLAGCGDKQQASGNNSAADAPAAVDQPRNDVTVEGVTPMADRVAVLGFLNKRNGIVRNISLKPGQAVRIKDAIVRLRACEQSAPWEPQALTGAFVQLDVERTDKQWQRVFSGWLYKESPSLNVVEHPVYDVWPKSCTMSFPPGPPPPAAASDSSNRSSAPKSGGSTPAAGAREDAPEGTPAPPPSPEPIAADSNAT